MDLIALTHQKYSRQLCSLFSFLFVILTNSILWILFEFIIFPDSNLYSFQLYKRNSGYYTIDFNSFGISYCIVEKAIYMFENKLLVSIYYYTIGTNYTILLSNSDQHSNDLFIGIFFLINNLLILMIYRISKH